MFSKELVYKFVRINLVILYWNILLDNFVFLVNEYFGFIFVLVENNVVYNIFDDCDVIFIFRVKKIFFYF